MPAPSAPDCLARLALGLGGDRAGIDDHRASQAGSGGSAADNPGFE
jgi:hypothetical protein